MKIYLYDVSIVSIQNILYVNWHQINQNQACAYKHFTIFEENYETDQEHNLYVVKPDFEATLET